MTSFQLQTTYQPLGDQPEAISRLVEGLQAGMRQQILHGATGTGKTFTIANVIADTQRPTLIMAHNKTLAAQLYSEFSQFFPHNAVSFFVSYYDYYQPEAYIPRTDTYIEKTTDINAEIERMRLAATQALATRRDVIVVATVSAIYALGDPAKYDQARLEFKVGKMKQRSKMLRYLVSMQYSRNDLDFQIGTFRLRGDVLEIRPSYTQSAYRITFWGEEVEQITEIDPLTGEILDLLPAITIHPARHFMAAEDDITFARRQISAELESRLAELRAKNQLLEAHRLEQRTRYDLEMMQELGYCPGIENYTFHFAPERQQGEPPWTLIDYFPDDFLLVVDESHMTLPQIRAMYRGDRQRKQTLVDFGFRLPSALDNRPLTFTEWEARAYQIIHTTATPGPYELAHNDQLVEQIIRPTGLLDPQITIRPIKGQVDDLLAELRRRITAGQRALVTTLTKRMAEDLSAYLLELGIKVHYLHSEIQTFDRVERLHDLRLGAVDAVVGINLLREGLDLPEVSLVAILDADKEGFLRSETALVQTIGRAARHVDGLVIMYADRTTASMARAIAETNRRREKQLAYNLAHGITPQTVQKELLELLPTTKEPVSAQKGVAEPAIDYKGDELHEEIAFLQEQMKNAAALMEFERAARLRDQIIAVKKMAINV
jgi:excinuclease ABC subunit B